MIKKILRISMIIILILIFLVCIPISWFILSFEGLHMGIVFDHVTKGDLEYVSQEWKIPLPEEYLTVKATENSANMHRNKYTFVFDLTLEMKTKYESMLEAKEFKVSEEYENKYYKNNETGFSLKYDEDSDEDLICMELSRDVNHTDPVAQLIQEKGIYIYRESFKRNLVLTIILYILIVTGLIIGLYKT